MRPQMKFSGPVLDAPDVAELAHFYEQFLGWPIQDIAGPRPGHPPGDGWAVLRPEEPQQGHKIEIQFEEHYVTPAFPGTAGESGMQLHLDFWVEDVDAGVAWCEECGGRQAEWQPENRDPSRLRVMLDPAGHPFCLWS